MSVRHINVTDFNLEAHELKVLQTFFSFLYYINDISYFLSRFGGESVVSCWSYVEVSLPPRTVCPPACSVEDVGLPSYRLAVTVISLSKKA
jgi:hypothetical protein